MSSRYQYICDADEDVRIILECSKYYSCTDFRTFYCLIKLWQSLKSIVIQYKICFNRTDSKKANLTNVLQKLQILFLHLALMITNIT